MGIRFTGLLQGVELITYDLIMKLRSSERSGIIDSRIVVIEITEEDIAPSKYEYPITDEALANAISELASHQPLAIGVDIHRRQKRGEGREKLIQLFKKYPRLITVCAFGFDQKNSDSQYSPPLGIKPSQIGFSDLIFDDDLSKSQSKIRRQLLSYSPTKVISPSNCTHQESSLSLSFKLAYIYLSSQGIKPIQANSEKNWQFGETVFSRLPKRFGAYQNLDGDVSDIMINYRHQRFFSRRFSLSEVLEKTIKPEWIKSKIILIGYSSSSPTAVDISSTPIGDLPGVWIHAHMTSQIISAVLDERSQIRAFSQWGDGLVVLFDSTISAIVVLSVRKLSPHVLILKLSLGFVTWSIILFFVYLSFLESGLWLPFIPSVLASFIVFTIGSILFTRYSS
jgi:CHASE2 domain-containing sensor protein